MKMVIKKHTVLLLLVLFIIPVSCGKYDDGPWFSIYSKKERATGNWRFESVIIDGVNKTEEYANQTVNMLRSGDVHWIQGHIDSPWNTYGPSGKWSFINSKNQIEMHFTMGVSSEFTLVWDIKRMAYGDLQLERYEEGKRIEWKMWKY